ncbi:hypothetical protein [Succinivibrio dextrinosolvens]|uniref:hypothetical protein n=1 Tax=Succinivibrio dextrinosolvens TaxID=83771 RepID=UPI00241E6FD7|nr:hypothetical protein [Succinivibrio dextrinosolvens]MBE6422596.1 hypothetical protein [Succinivibrio dextrinosolvens]
MAIYTVIDPEKILADFKKSVFEKHGVNIPDDDPFCLEVELMACLVENIQQQNFQLCNAFQKRISEVSQIWVKKEEKVWEDYQQRCDALLNAFSKNSRELYHQAMIEAITKAENTRENKEITELKKYLKSQIVSTQNFLYISIGLGILNLIGLGSVLGFLL